MSIAVFCQNCSTVAAPLTHMLKAKSKLIWFASCQQAFGKIKVCFSVPVLLLAPRFSQPLELHVDAGQEVPLLPDELLFGGLALIWALRSFHSGMTILLIY